MKSLNFLEILSLTFPNKDEVESGKDGCFTNGNLANLH
jgi:hypothetical protein